MKLVHFSKSPLDLIDLYDQEQDESPDHKPKGFWVSDESEPECWSQWTKMELFYDDYFDNLNIYEINLSNNAKILHLKSPLELIKFTNQYKVTTTYLGSIIPAKHNYQINWKLVAEKYDGIIITPYIWQCRLRPETRWYYGWDVASGCIWNVDAIESIKVMEKVV